jgi:hypothetical protein
VLPEWYRLIASAFEYLLGENRGVADAWMLDELAHAGLEHLDAAFVSGFDKKQGYPDPDGDVAAFEAHGLGPSSAVVDLGAGTGQFAIAAARRFGRVTAADVSPVMVDALRAKAATEGLDNLHCVRAGFLSYAPGRAARGRRLHEERAAPGPGLLEGARAAADRGHAASGRRAAAARPDLRLPAA